MGPAASSFTFTNIFELGFVYSGASFLLKVKLAKLSRHGKGAGVFSKRRDGCGDLNLA